MFKAVCVKTCFSHKGSQLEDKPSYVKGNIYNFNEGTPELESYGYYLDKDYECSENELGNLGVMNQNFFDEYFVKINR